ncbi:hypothetical protein GF380_05380 [Candidatus Uhrbacteria bacterium]|nr:hypothetical protein [Candidatus Uhrbacteria bacterium]MBD3284462.1 hypothetical protein [Candidatus Uhrbacteria bacterium]
MGIKGYLSLIGLGTFLAWFAWVIILFNVSPKETGVAGLVMFYTTLAVALIGTLTVFMTTFRVYLLKRKVLGREIRKAFRHAVLFSVISIVSLILSSAGSFKVWHVVILVAVVSAMEYLFLQFHRGRG